MFKVEINTSVMLLSIISYLFYNYFPLLWIFHLMQWYEEFLNFACLLVLGLLIVLLNCLPDSARQGPAQNIRAWIKYATTSCQVR